YLAALHSFPTRRSSDLELRTPLNAIIGWVHILKRRGALAGAEKGLEAIERNVKTQARIISDILDVSRINSGKLRLAREWVDPAEDRKSTRLNSSHVKIS